LRIHKLSAFLSAGFHCKKAANMMAEHLEGNARLAEVRVKRLRARDFGQEMRACRCRVGLAQTEAD